MDAHEVNRVRAKLALFVADVFASVPRRDQRAKGDCYLRGLMLDSRRKSIQAMASRLPDGNEQNLQQFVNQSTWDPAPVQRRICERMLPLITPTAWVIDDVSVPKDGRMSAGVAPQYCGALGKRANCQVAVSVHAATDTASCPLQWRLFLPEEWAADVTAHPFGVQPVAPERNGLIGCWPQPRYRQTAPSVAALATDLGQEVFTPVTWRNGSRGELRSRFAALRVRPAGKAVERPIRAAASAGQGWWDGVLPDCWLLAEWPDDVEAPTDYWLSNLPADTPIADLVRLAKVRWRIEHDYSELKHGLGLDHFEGRSWPGWHHHVTLVTAAHAFLTEQRLSPKVPGPVSASTRSSMPSRTS